ncbi:MAG TPA: response regulator transcription factor [Candidatus Dormibacteraeota bacterium]|nr:response regulator transcription factor [Candidatus Dormibacteraeota bacterium]
MASLLLIDDEPAILRALGIGLRARGYDVHTARSGAEGLSEAAHHHPEVVVLDLRLPDMDGIEVCRQLRSWTQVPVLILSAHGEEDRKVAALDAGADDFVTKPFGMAELEARIRVALRHQSDSQGGSELVVGPLRMDLAGHTVSMRDKRVALTATEYEMLAYLARNVGKVVTHDLLLAQVWGGRYGADAHYLRVYANRLRRKLGLGQGQFLVTHAGIGYELRDDEGPQAGAGKGA